MSTSHIFSILIWINASRSKNNQAELFARITINQKRVNISLKRKVDIATWDKHKSRIKGNSQNARVMNQYIEKVRSEIQYAYDSLKFEKKLITSQLVKARFLGVDDKNYSITSIIKYHNENMGHKIHKNTLRSYKTSQRYILEYISSEYKTTDLFLSDLNYEFIIGFESFLRSYKCKETLRTIANNTAMKHIQRLRKMINMALALEWLDKDPFVKFKSKLEKRDREFLTQEELTLIEKQEYRFSRLELVKDLFLFSCYTGLSYVDLMSLSKDNVLRGVDGGFWIQTIRQKTKTPVRFPLLDFPFQLIHKYADDVRATAKGRLFPSMSNQKLNAYLKEIADLCGITKNLTFHMARHTFATTVTLTNGVPIETVSKMLGHTKLTTTQIYARVIESKMSDDMNNLRTVLKSKKEEVSEGQKLNVC